MVYGTVVSPRESYVLLPTQYYHFGSTEVHLIGRHPGDIGATKDPRAQKLIANYVARHGVRELFAINPSEFNGKVVPAEAAYFPDHVTYGEVTIHFNAFVDGIVGLCPGQGSQMRTGDCFNIELVGHGEVAVLHGGLHSLLVPYWKPGFAAVPNRPSVIQEGIAHMTTSPDQLQVRLICGAGPDSYLLKRGHPVHGPHNERLMQEVCARWGGECIRLVSVGQYALSIPHLITAQLIQLGVPRNNITHDGIDTINDRDASGNFVFSSAARGDKERNHVIILFPRH